MRRKRRRRKTRTRRKRIGRIFKSIYQLPKRRIKQNLDLCGIQAISNMFICGIYHELRTDFEMGGRSKFRSEF